MRLAQVVRALLSACKTRIVFSLNVDHSKIIVRNSCLALALERGEITNDDSTGTFLSLARPEAVARERSTDYDERKKDR